MKRTTIMADDHLLDELRRIARGEGVSLAHVIREGLELRAKQPRKRPSFIGAFASGEPGHTAARDSADAPFEPLSWR